MDTIVFTTKNDHRANFAVTQQGKTIKARLYRTDIVEIDPAKKTVTLDSGGWRTATTKKRMNQVFTDFGLGIGVYQKAYDWFIQDASGQHIIFCDGITLSYE